MGMPSRHPFPPEPVTLPAAGTVIEGRYELGRLFGRGAMGVVYDGVDLTTGTDVAVKVLPPMALNDRTKERFLREIQLTAAIDHPNVIKTHGAGLFQQVLPYIVMEKLSGETLASRLLSTGVVSTKHALEILIDVMPALQAVHENDIFHRDVKPANVFLAERGAVLFDFGLSLDASRQTRLTGQGIAIGTPGYMAPEQILDSKADARTDVYGVCATAYEALTGIRPIASREKVVHKVFETILHEKPKPLRSVQPGCPQSVETLIMRGLEKKPDDRFQTATVMHQECLRVFSSL